MIEEHYINMKSILIMFLAKFSLLIFEFLNMY